MYRDWGENTVEIFKNTWYGWAVSPNPTGVVTIPSTLGGKRVIRIGAEAFSHCDGMTDVRMPDGVNYIGASAFLECSGLKGITIPDSITHIHKGTFEGCRGLTSIVIPSSVTNIDEFAFYGCRGLRSVTIPDSVTCIGYEAFMDCSGLTNVTLSGCPISIGQGAFERCSGLTSVTIPSGVTHIGPLAFSYCDKLVSVTIMGSETVIWEIAFAYCSGLKVIHFKGMPPPCKSIFSDTNGTYLPEYESEWKAVIDSSGYWHGLKMQMFGTSHVVTFNPNGGIGAMAPQIFENGAEQKLSKNGYRKDGYTFQGWVSNSIERAELAAAGVIAVDYTDEQEITVDSEMTLYAVWANPPLTLVAESADWSNGSITLKCEDSDSSGAEHEYSLEYKNENGTWVAVDGAQKVSATKGQNANSEEVWIAKLKDSAFSSRLGGIQTVEYRVKDDKNGRASAGCVTRTRYGLFVGYDDFDFRTGNVPKRGHYNDAFQLRNLCVERGGFLAADAHFRGNATTESITNDMAYFAASAQPGDLFVFYISTHGNGYEEMKDGVIVRVMPGLATYDGSYSVKMLQNNVRAFNSGVAVVNVIMACRANALAGTMSGKDWVDNWLLKCGFAECLGNVAWITSCNAEQSSFTYTNEDNSRFGQSFIVDGFRDGYADAELYGVEFDGVEYKGGNTDGVITLGELGRYAGAFARGLSDDEPADVKLENSGLLDRIVMEEGVVAPSMSRPEPPVNVEASQRLFALSIKVGWSAQSSATSYRIYRQPLSSPEALEWIGLKHGSFYYDSDVLSLLLGREYIYRVQAVNQVGISDLSEAAVGERGTTPYISFLGRYIGLAFSAATVGEYDAAEKAIAANGCRTVGECYALGINPEDPNDDLKISHFEMKDGKPVITLNHTEDGSGNSFVPRVKTLGKANLSDAEWREVPEEGDPSLRFFKVEVEMP
jgi:hypothetical protein